MRNFIKTVVTIITDSIWAIIGFTIGVISGLIVLFKVLGMMQEVKDGTISELAYQNYCKYKSLYYYLQVKRCKPRTFKRLVNVAYSAAYNTYKELKY